MMGPLSLTPCWAPNKPSLVVIVELFGQHRSVIRPWTTCRSTLGALFHLILHCALSVLVIQLFVQHRAFDF